MYRNLSSKGRNHLKIWGSGVGVRFIHGDLKPANVLWKERRDAQEEAATPGPDGWPLLTDFGSAQAFSTMHPGRRPLGANEKIRAHGWTRGFEAPEVFGCGGKWRTMRSDMYSWARTIIAISRCRQLPADLDALCKACLASDPAERLVELFVRITRAIRVNIRGFQTGGFCEGGNSQ